MTHKPSYELTPDSPAVEVLFRIEKVSSKIGLFKLYIEPDYGDGAQGPIGGVFTDNIEVKSKVNDKAKAQYIDSIQNVLVPVAGHPGPMMLGNGGSSQGALGRNSSDLVQVSGHGVRGNASHHGSSGGGSASPMMQQHAGGHTGVDLSYLGAVPTAVARSHAYHGGAGRAEASSSVTGGCLAA